MNLLTIEHYNVEKEKEEAEESIDVDNVDKVK